MATGKQVSELAQILDGPSIHGEFPHPHNSVQICRHYVIAIGKETGINRPNKVSQRWTQRVSSVRVPNPGSSIITCCDYPFAIRTERRGYNRGFMIKRPRKLATRVRIPNDCFGILAGGHNARPIRAESRGHNSISVLEFKFEFPRNGIPQSSLAFQKAIFNLARQQDGAIGAEFRVIDLGSIIQSVRMRQWGIAFTTRCWVPNTDICPAPNGQFLHSGTKARGSDWSLVGQQ